MVNERPVRVIALRLTLVTLTACATVSLQLYDGPPRPRVVAARTEAGHAYTFKTLDDEAVTVVMEDKGVSYDPLCLDPRRYREGNNC